jgi:uncharacterized repeat protein (TIGR01451 family)
MHYQRRRIRISALTLLLATLLVMTAAPFALAAGTPSGTTIQNRATINYSVGAVPQTLIESSPTGNSTPGEDNGVDTTFRVDNRVDLTVASLGSTDVIPGQADRVLAFSITNTGNTTQGYRLDVVNGATDIAMDDIRIYHDLDNSGTPDDGELYVAGSNVADVDADGSIRVLIVADTPIGAVNGDTDTYWLRATTLDAGTEVVTTQTRVDQSDDPLAVDVVFADGDGDGGGAADALRDGRHMASGVFTVTSAALTVVKTSAVIEDINGENANAKAIPGARVRYTLTITNNGAATAEGVTLTDSVPENTTFVAESIRINGASGGSFDGFIVTAPVGNIPYTDGSQAVVTFEVTID